MNLTDIVQRSTPPQPWLEGDNIPWNEPEFSRRMLKEHLSQQHDAASRRFEIIDRHVAWINDTILETRSARVLDMGCGPGLYLQRLSRLGHACTGIDFSPASIEHAISEAQREGLSIDYRQGDLREIEFGYERSYDLVMFLFGEFNVFSPEHIRLILQKAHRALRTGGFLLLEPHNEESLRRLGQQPPAWYSAPSGLFSDRPHLVLEESFWLEQPKVTTTRYFSIDAETHQVTRHAASYQAYSQEEYWRLLEDNGFTLVKVFPGLAAAETAEPDRDFISILAQKVGT
jgi:SAM-dependent methyltransferase